jgi:hypothetical protein
LTAVLPIGEYLDRYSALEDTCEVWMGDELLGAGCAEACAHLEEVCPDDPFWVCQHDCALLPPESVECLQHATACVADSACNVEDFVSTSKSSGS